MENLQISVVNNNELLYYFIATQLLERKSLFVTWTDDEGMQFDILFALPLPVGEPGRGYRCGDLVVAISGMSCFHFNADKSSTVTYYYEKLGVYNDKLTVLLNTVRARLLEQYNQFKNVQS